MHVFEVPAEGPLLASEQDALDLIGATFGGEYDLIAVPVGRLAPEFFKLGTGLAGGFIQKFTNYRMRLAIVGDISAYVEKSKPLRDFVFESNRRGGEVVFVADISEL